jgi:hypothetical protein
MAGVGDVCVRSVILAVINRGRGGPLLRLPRPFFCEINGSGFVERAVKYAMRRAGRMDCDKEVEL